MARNTAINAFLEGQSDWLAMFDDDAIVDAGWLEAMNSALNEFPDAKVFAGPHIRTGAARDVLWQQSGAGFPRKHGRVYWNVSEANTMYHRSIFSQNGMNMCHDMTFNLTGGSDTHLFFSLKDKNVKIFWVAGALMHEPIHEARTSFGRKIARSINNGSNWGTSIILREGAVWGRIHAFILGILFMVNLGTYGLASLVIFMFSRRHSLALWIKSMKSGAESLGMFRCLFWRSAPIYAVVDGDWRCAGSLTKSYHSPPGWKKRRANCRGFNRSRTANG